LLQLPKKEFLMDAAQRRRALCGLIDLLFAYCYEVRTALGDHSVEAGWNLRSISSLLSYLDCFEAVAEVAVASVHRSLCYPLFRHWDLAMTVLADVTRLLQLGRPAVLKALVETRHLVQRGLDYGYLLNRCWLDDYCVWLQQQPPRRLARLATTLSAVRLERGDVGWPLAAYEELAATAEDEL